MPCFLFPSLHGLVVEALPLQIRTRKLLFRARGLAWRATIVRSNHQAEMPRYQRIFGPRRVPCNAMQCGAFPLHGVQLSAQFEKILARALDASAALMPAPLRTYTICPTAYACRKARPGAPFLPSTHWGSVVARQERGKGHLPREMSRVHSQREGDLHHRAAEIGRLSLLTP